MDGILIVGTLRSLPSIATEEITGKLSNVGNEGYIISSTSIHDKKVIIISANEDIGLLYGVFNFLRLLQTHQNINELSVESSPQIKVRMLNHWDNLV
jgi:alpha-glucuronidase